eukprot:1066137-Ditylum_brightwellii.AAC.1
MAWLDPTDSISAHDSAHSLGPKLNLEVQYTTASSEVAPLEVLQTPKKCPQPVTALLQIHWALGSHPILEGGRVEFSIGIPVGSTAHLVPLIVLGGAHCSAWLRLFPPCTVHQPLT